MAYYTIAHKLQGANNIDGLKTGPSGITPEQLTPAVFDFIFLGKEIPAEENCPIPSGVLSELRAEFLFWYPMNLRVSGKDLIKNHLTMSLYNHAAIWKEEPEMWPRSYFTNGHVMVDAEKMSKSVGNFITLIDGLRGEGSKSWSTDAVRFALADAGDGMEDANFECERANRTVLDLTTELVWVEEVLSEAGVASQRSGEYNYNDKVFFASIARCVQEAHIAYSQMRYRDALKHSFFILQGARNSYRDMLGKSGLAMHRDLVVRFVEVQAVILSPITPHFSDYLWTDAKCLGKDSSVINAAWPTANLSDEDIIMLKSNDFLQTTISNWRSAMDKKKSKKKKGKKSSAAQVVPTHATVFVSKEYPIWKQRTIDYLAENFDKSEMDFPCGQKQLMAGLMAKMKTDEEMKKQKKMLMKVAAFIAAEARSRGVAAFEKVMPFDEAGVLRNNMDFITKSLGIKEIEVFDAAGDLGDKDPNNQAKDATPGKPKLFLYAKASSVLDAAATASK